MANENKAPRSARGSSRARAGLPAKAGRRKIYTTGRRKTKDFTPKARYSMKDVPEHFQARPPAAKQLRAMLRKINELERRADRASISDPFMFDRMRTHAKAGIYDPLN